MENPSKIEFFDHDSEGGKDRTLNGTRSLNDYREKTQVTKNANPSHEDYTDENPGGRSPPRDCVFPLLFLLPFLSLLFLGMLEWVAAFRQQGAAWLCGGFLNGDRIYGHLRNARQLL